MKINDQINKIKHLPNIPIPVILDANWVNSLGVIRGLGKIGLKSIAINYDKRGVGLFSKYTIGLIGPNPWNNPDGLIDFLITIGKNLPQKGILFVTDDKYLETLAKERMRLDPFFHFTFPEYSKLEKLFNKQNQYAAAEKLGIGYPRSRIVNSAVDIEDWSANFFPTIVKGASGKEFFHSFGRQAIEVQSKEEILIILEQKQDFKLLIQEHIPGGEENLYTIGCFINKDGIAKGIFMGRKLRQYPRYYGTCTVGESIICPEIIEPALALLRELKFYGVSQVEFKKDTRDNFFKLIEINGRFWKWHSLATATGINLAATAYYDTIGSEEYTPKPQKKGLKWIVIPEDLLGVHKDIQSGKFQFFNWLKIISPPFVFGLFDIKDIRPWVMMVIFKFGKLLKIFFKKFLLIS